MFIVFFLWGVHKGGSVDRSVQWSVDQVRRGSMDRGQCFRVTLIEASRAPNTCRGVPYNHEARNGLGC